MNHVTTLPVVNWLEAACVLAIALAALRLPEGAPNSTAAGYAAEYESWPCACVGVGEGRAPANVQLEPSHDAAR